MNELLVTAMLFVSAIAFGAWRPAWALAPARSRLLLMIWHMAWCLAYWEIAKTSVADASVYLSNGAVGQIIFIPGTRFINSVAVVLVQYLGFTPLNCYLVFSLPGALGLLLLQGVLWEVGGGSPSRLIRLSRLLVWLPGLSFWSVAPGKDGMALLAVCASIHATLSLTTRWRWLVFGVTLMFLVRPHMASLMLVAALGAHLMGGRQDYGQVLVLALLLGAAAFAVPFTLDYIGLGALENPDDLTAYVEHRQGYNMDGGSSVDIAEMNPLLRIPTFMFRPLFVDAPSLTALAASVENFILLAFCLVAGRRALRVRSALRGFGFRFCVTYSFMAWLVLSQLTSNLGIAVRQKTMILPAIFTMGVMALAAPLAKRPSRFPVRQRLSTAT